jgi:hypothetical protein
MKNQGWRTGTIGSFGILAAWFIACAGEDTPPVGDDLRGALASSFGGEFGQTGSAGAAGAGGSGSGRAGSGSQSSGGRSGSANAGGGAAGAAGGGEPVSGGSGNGGGSVCDAFDTIIIDRCGSVGCHGPNSINGDFGVAEEDVINFVDAESVNSECDQLVIDTSNPENSLIYTKVTGDYPTDCGAQRMPLTGDFLTPEEEECLLDWVSQF